MILVDAYALVALLEDEPVSVDVGRLLRRSECAITAVNLAEALDVVTRRRGIPAAELHRVVDPLTESLLPVVGVDERTAWRAAEIRARHYDRRDSALSLADCFLLARATPGADKVATSDVPVARAARAEGVGVVALADSDGRPPT